MVSLLMAYRSSGRFWQARHPPRYAALLTPSSPTSRCSSLDDATKFIANEKLAAARIYLSSATVKTSTAELMRMLEDPDTRYSVAPQGVMTFAGFMSRVGIMRVKPESWKDLFVPEIRDLPGS